MLELRPNCEHCSKALPPNASDAMICSFECTFCEACMNALENVCPNCGGGFTRRPIRPAHDLKSGNFLGRYPASGKAKLRPVDMNAHRQFAVAIKSISPTDR
jgi:hypothetical protein